MHQPSSDKPHDLWLVDGSLRDVYIQETNLQDWDSFLNIVRGYLHHCTQDGVAIELPDAASIFANREHTYLLRIEAGSVGVNCHFFMLEEVELDIDPKEVSNASQHFAVLQLLEELATVTGKDVLITPENSPDVVLLRFEQGAKLWRSNERPANQQLAPITPQTPPSPRAP